MSIKKFAVMYNKIQESLDCGAITVKEYYKLMMEYHSEYAEYWDNKVGTIYNNDNKCTKEWNRHNRELDRYFNLLKSM